MNLHLNPSFEEEDYLFQKLPKKKFFVPSAPLSNPSPVQLQVEEDIRLLLKLLPLNSQRRLLKRLVDTV